MNRDEKPPFVPPDLPKEGIRELSATSISTVMETVGGVRRAYKAKVKITGPVLQDIVHDIVPDPVEPGARSIAAVNRHADILRIELDSKRISPEGYAAGRVIEAAFERARLGGGGQWRDGDRIDALTSQTAAIVRGLDRATDVVAVIDGVRSIVGKMDTMILRCALGDRLPFDAIAVSFGRPGDRGTRYIAARFRDAVNNIGNADSLDWAFR
jgi:hypothetical protein